MLWKIQRTVTSSETDTIPFYKPDTHPHTVHSGPSTPLHTLKGAACWELPVEGGEQTAGGQHQRAPGQDRALVVDPVQVATGHVSHANGTSRAVQKLVAIPERENVSYLAHCALGKGKRKKKALFL